MTASPHVVSLGWETDQYDLRTRVKVRGPLTTLKTAWTEQWRTSKIKYPVGIWYDPEHPSYIRVLDRSTKKIYKLRQSDRAIIGSLYIGGSVPHPLGLSGDPANSDRYWVLEAPWKTTGVTTGNKLVKFRKSDNKVVARYALPNGRWSALKVSSSHVWLANLDTDKIHKRSKSDGSAIASYQIKVDPRHTFPQTGLGVAQVNPSGLMIDGTNIYYMFAGTGRFLKASTSAPRTLTQMIRTAGSNLVGGEMDTDTHQHCYGGSDGLHLVAKFKLTTPVTYDVAQEAIDIDLEDELGELAQVEPRIHDAHPLEPAHPFLVRRETISIDEVTSLAQAMQVAQTTLETLNHRRTVYDVGAVGNPAIQKGDLVRVTDPLVGITVDGLVDTLETDMSADSPYLMTMALLPQSVIVDDTPGDDGSSADDTVVDEVTTPDTSDPGPDD